MACTWLSEDPSSYSCSLTLLLGPAWVLLKYVLQTFFLGPTFGTDTTVAFWILDMSQNQICTGLIERTWSKVAVKHWIVIA